METLLGVVGVVLILDALVAEDFIQDEVQAFLPQARFLLLGLQGCLQCLNALTEESGEILANNFFSVVAVAVEGLSQVA